MNDREGAASRLWFTVSATVLAAAHVLLVLYYVPFRHVFSQNPLQGVDFDLHIGQVYRVVEGLRDWGHSWVYDPRLVAGQPEGTITDAGSKAWELWTYVLVSCGVSLPVAFNTWVPLVMLAAPLLIYFASRAFELGPQASLLAAALASLLWFFDSFIHWVWFVGMVSWALASCLSTLTLGLFYRFTSGGKLRFAFGCALTLAVGHLIHPYTFFVLAGPMLALYWRHFRSLQRSAHLAVVAMVMCTFAVNAYWLAVAVRHWHYILDSAYFAQGRLTYLFYDFLGVLRAGENTGVIGVRTGFRVLVLALAVAGLLCLRRARDARTLPLALATLGMTAVGYVGAEIPVLSQVQPYRFLVATALFCTIPAAVFLMSLRSELGLKMLATPFKILMGVAAVVTFQHLAQEVLYFTPRLLPDSDKFSDHSPSPLTKYGFLTRLGGPSHVTYSLPHDAYIEPGYEECIRWLETHARPGSRLLVQGSVLGERIAWRTGFEVIGGFVERNVSHAYANYFRRYQTSPSVIERMEYLQAYSIDYVVAAQRYPEFLGVPSVRVVTEVAGFRIFQNLRPTGRVLEGRGLVSARTNVIEVADSDPNAALVVSYHFHEALRCSPDCQVKREDSSFDPVGLIRIPAPHPRAFRIYNSYE